MNTNVPNTTQSLFLWVIDAYENPGFQQFPIVVVSYSEINDVLVDCAKV